MVFSLTAALSRCVFRSRATEIGVSSVSATCSLLLLSLDVSWSTCTYLVRPPTLTKRFVRPMVPPNHFPLLSFLEFQTLTVDPGSNSLARKVPSLY